MPCLTIDKHVLLASDCWLVARADHGVHNHSGARAAPGWHAHRDATAGSAGDDDVGCAGDPDDDDDDDDGGDAGTGNAGKAVVVNPTRKMQKISRKHLWETI